MPEESAPDASEVPDGPEATEVAVNEVVREITREDILDVEVSVKFSVGAAKTSLREVASIRPGYTFETESKVDSPVTIELNGAKLGRGELVMIDGRIGVRVTEYRDHE